MKNLLLCGVMCLATTPAIAETIFVDAPVLSVNQLYKTSEIRTPVQNCSQQLVPYNTGSYNQHRPNVGGGIVGGVVGGLLGNQFGRGRGNAAATALGAVSGVIIGSQMQYLQTLHQNPVTHYEQKTVCTTSYNISHNQIPDGYLVKYEFGGKEYQTKTYYQPSSTIKLKVTTSLME